MIAFDVVREARARLADRIEAWENDDMSMCALDMVTALRTVRIWVLDDHRVYATVADNTVPTRLSYLAADALDVWVPGMGDNARIDATNTREYCLSW